MLIGSGRLKSDQLNDCVKMQCLIANPQKPFMKTLQQRKNYLVNVSDGKEVKTIQFVKE